jgi:hypothetical protein
MLRGVQVAHVKSLSQTQMCMHARERGKAHPNTPYASPKRNHHQSKLEPPISTVFGVPYTHRRQ